MRGNEVLVHREAFTEVGRDRGLDDRAIRTGHEATHARKLANLRGGTTRTGVGVHVDGVEGVLFDLFAVRGAHALLRQSAHHGLGDLVVRARPDVDHLVVLLALGDETGCVLLLDLLHLGFGVTDDRLLLDGNIEVIHTDGAARARRILEAGVHELVGEDDRVLQTAAAIAGVQQAGDRLLRHRTIDHLEGEFLRDDLIEERAADGGVHERALLRRVAFLVDLVLDDADLHARM